MRVLGELEVVPQGEPQSFFSGPARKVAVVLRNPQSKALEVDLRMRLFQTSSATAVLLNEAPWKRLQVLGGQTVLESATLALPSVTAGTRLLIQWTAGPSNVIGRTELWVYPPGLLRALKPLVGEESLGVFDPENQLKPLLNEVGLALLNLEDSGLEDFSGKLAIVGPFQSKAQLREGLSDQIKRMAQRGVAVVWLQPPLPERERTAPSFYTVPSGKGAVVVVEAGLVVNLPENPKAQLNLIRFAGLALHPEPSRLPFLTPEPTTSEP